MKILIIEDELLAAQRLEGLVRKLLPGVELCGPIDSVKKSVEWFTTYPHPDLVLLDIQLADGLSFEIFEQTLINCPVIFTTAYDEYALKAFKLNSIDYLLKPIDVDQLQAALAKFSQLHPSKNESFQNKSLIYDEILKFLSHQYKSRFVIKTGERIRVLKTDEIEVFYSSEKATYALSFEGKNHLLDHSLEQVENLVDPSQFYRINRKYLISLKAIKEIYTYSNSRLKVKLQHITPDDCIVSREKVVEFKKWLNQ